MAQLTSLIWSFLYVQTYLMPRRVSMNVKCLFQSSIYTIKMSHSTLLIISSALPRYRVIFSFKPPLIRLILSIMDGGKPFFKPEFDSSKARPFESMNFEKRGVRRFLEIISRRKSNRRVFLFRRTPSYIQCFYLYIAMQVYYSPNLRRQKKRVITVQYTSGIAESIFIKNREDFNILLVVGRSQVRAMAKLEENLCLSFDSISCNLRISGL